jgi:hypothetical protein
VKKRGRPPGPGKPTGKTEPSPRDLVIIDVYKSGKTLRECAHIFLVTHEAIRLVIIKWAPEYLRGHDGKVGQKEVIG